MNDKVEQRTALTFRQKMEVIDVLKTVCRGENGFAMYDKDWNDRKASELATTMLGYTVKHHHIAFLRKEMFGDIMVTGTDKRLEHKKIPELEKQLLDQALWGQKIEAKLKELESRINTVELALKFNVGVKLK